MNEKEIDTEIRHITPAGGNIFADLGFDREEAGHMMTNARLAIAIDCTIKKRQISREQAATLLGLTEFELSDMLRGRFRDINEDKMREYLAQLEHQSLD